MKITKEELMFDKLTSMIKVEELENYKKFTDLIPEMKESGVNVEAVKKLVKICLAGLFLKKYPNFKLVENLEDDTKEYWFVIRNEFVREINTIQYHNSLVKGETISEKFVEALVSIRDKVTLT